ncbi:helix-turn-helix transcriptional regulator, partial [Haloarcula sp. AONF1]
RQQTGDGITSPSTTRIRLALNSDRSADWTVVVRYSLADENETRVFRDAGDRFLDGEVGPSAELFEGFRREANRNVDRSMAIEDVEREVVVHEDPGEFDVATEDAVAVGELRLRFTWTSFLAQDGESLVLGDALTTPGNETWLRSLEAGQTLEVATPEGYTVTGTPSSAVTQLSDGDVIIEGPQTFEGGEPVVIVYGPAGAGAPWTMLMAAIVLAAALVAGSVVGYRRINDGERDPNESAANGGERAASGGGGPGPVGVGDAGPGTGGDAGADATDEADDGDGEDLSLLSDEERVERLLDANGGRMRQADIVAETGWSDAKVSQLLSAMADEGRVEKLRLGRENLISLPDDEAGGDDAGEDE